MGKSGNQRALVVGISNYPDPANRLPAVAADVREMAKVLSSKQGAFSKNDVVVLADKEATRRRVVDALRSAFGGTAVETVFVYLAGHGLSTNGNYFFVAHDSNDENTAIPLTEIKALFDGTKSRRVFLWLDFCHSGGILARGATTDDIADIRRAIGVVSGEGKIIVAACTSAQSSYESTTIGHGFFTHALLRGLRGEAKSAQGEVTALSLYEFIDHQVANLRQQPVFFGQTTGRIVLAHYPERASAPVKQVKSSRPTKPARIGVRNKAGTWVMLGEHFLLADTVRHGSQNKIEIKATTTKGEDAAVFADMRPGRYGANSAIPFAVNNEAHVVRVQAVESETVSGKQVWTIHMDVEEDHFGNTMEGTYSVGSNTYSPDDIARLRASRMLLNDPAPVSESKRGYSSADFLMSHIEGSGKYPVKTCLVRDVFAKHGKDLNWKHFARLKCVFMLRASGAVEQILELALGTVRSGQVAVSLKARRSGRYTGMEPTTIELKGNCPLQ